MEDLLEKKEFYELMQTYRHIDISNQLGVTYAFEQVKEFIKNNFEPKQANPTENRVIASEHTKGSSANEELAITKLERLHEECTQCKKLKSLLRDAVDWAKCGNYLTEIDDDSQYKIMRLERGIGKSYKITVNLIRAIFNKATAPL